MRSTIVWTLAAAMLLLGAAPRANAGFAPSRAVAVPETDRAADLETVRAVLETKLVRDRLADLGHPPEEIEARLADLSDAQLHRLATDLDELRTGGDSALGVVLGVLLIILLVVLILELTGNDVVVE